VRWGLAKVILFVLHLQSTGQEYLTLCIPCIILTNNHIFNVLLLQYQECCVGNCTTVYFGIPEDGILALKHAGILYVVYDFLVVLCAFVRYCNYL